MSRLHTVEHYQLPSEPPAESHPPWQLDVDRVALLVHDMQNYFLRPFRSVPFFPRFEENCSRILTTSRRRELPIFYTGQPGNMSTEQRGLLADFWGPGMTADNSDRDFARRLAPRPEDHRLVKWRYSAFHDTALLDGLRERGRDQLIIVGVYAHIGILATAIDAMSHGIQPFVPVDAIADFSAGEHSMAVDYIAKRCGRVLSTESTLGRLISVGSMPDRNFPFDRPDQEVVA